MHNNNTLLKSKFYYDEHCLVEIKLFLQTETFLSRTLSKHSSQQKQTHGLHRANVSLVLRCSGQYPPGLVD